MAEILLKSREQILADLVRTITANSDLTDIQAGSSLATLLEAVASVQFQNYLMVLKLLESTNLESMTGADLDRKAASIGLPNGIGGVGRKPASPSSGPIEIIDPRTPKKSSKLFAGKPSPFAGGTLVYVENAEGWPVPSGSSQPSIYIGRGTASNLEGPIKYTSLTNNGTYWTLSLEGPLTKNHSLSETVVLAQGGDRVIPAGTTVQTTPSASVSAVSFSTDTEVIILDGEESIETSVTCTTFGESGNVLAGAIKRFSTQPFPQAQVRNISTFQNGRSTESDEELRQRIRDYPATLARGTKGAITAALLGLRDPDTGKAIASVVVLEPTEAGEPSRIYIDDGSLLEPTFEGQSYELLVKNASGQEVFFKTTYVPITPCVAISANNGPYSLEDGQEIIVEIDGVTETFRVNEDNYQNLETATALEVVRDFNSQANICSFRTINNAQAVAVFDLSGTSEIMRIQAGTLQKTFGLPTTEIRPIYVYKNGVILSFKGRTATLTTENFPWTHVVSDLKNVVVKVDESTQVFTITNKDFSPYFTDIQSATLSNWVEVLKKKVSGVEFEIVGNTLVWSSLQKFTNDSYLEIGSKTARPAVYNATGSEVIAYADNNYAIDSAGLYNQEIEVVNADDVSLNGTWLAKIETVGGRTQISIQTSLVGSGSFSWIHETNPEAGWIGPTKMWSSAQSSVGSQKDFRFNRFTGEVRLVSNPSSGDTIEIGSLSTRAKIFSNKTVGGLFSVTSSIYGTSKLIVGFDGDFEVRTLGNSPSSRLRVATPSPYTTAEKIVRLESLDGILVDDRLFVNLEVDDWIYLVNFTGSGWDSSIGGLYKVKKISELKQWIDIEVDSTSFPLWTGTHDVLSGSLYAFKSSRTPQIIDFGSASAITVDQAVEIINSQVYSGTAEKISGEQLVLRTNAYNGGSVAIFAVIGNASAIFSAGSSSSVQPHVAAISTENVDSAFPVVQDILSRTTFDSGYGSRGYLKVHQNYTDILDNDVNPNIEAASLVTEYPIGYQEKWLTGRLYGYTGRVYNLESLAPFEGFVRGKAIIRPIAPFDTAISSGELINHRNISMRLSDLSITKDDRLVVEMDLDSVEKTVTVPMHKSAKIATCQDITGGGKGYSITFTLKDPDDGDKPFFDTYSPFKNFNFNDFNILTKSVGVYKFSGQNAAAILRSTSFGNANKLRFSVRYPNIADSSDIVVSHKNTFTNNVPEQIILATLASGSLIPGSSLSIGTLDLAVSQNGSVANIEFTGSNLDPTKYSVGNLLKFGGSHALSGVYKIAAVGASSVTVVAPGLLKYKTTLVSGSVAYTSSDSNVVKVYKANHGLIDGDKLNIIALSSIDGISSGDLSVSNAVVSYVDSDNFTYEASANANIAPSGSAQIEFPYVNRTMQTSPGTAEVTVTHVGHPFSGGEHLDFVASGSIGGIIASNLTVSNAIITYVNANQYKYSALAAAPSDTGTIDISRSHSLLDISTVNGSNIVTVNHPGHYYSNGVVLTVSSVPTMPAGSSLNASQLIGSKVITVINSNTYQFLASSVETGTPSGTGKANLSYGPYTMAVQTGDNTSTVTCTYSNHGLLSGATVNTVATSSIGGISATDLTATLPSTKTITVLSTGVFTFSANASSPNRTGTGDVRKSSIACTLNVDQIPPPGSNVVVVSATDHGIVSGEYFYITNAPALGIGGLTQAELQNNNNLLLPSSIQTNEFSYIAPGYGNSPSGSLEYVRLLSLPASQYPLSSFPLNATKNTLAKLAEKINKYGQATCEVAGNSAFVLSEATYLSHSNPYDSVLEVLPEMENAYDFHSFDCKYSGKASIYNYDLSGNLIQALVQSDDSLFPTKSEGMDGSEILYTPVNEEVCLIPTNGNTLERWLGFSAISSLSAQAKVESIDGSDKVQISSVITGFNGAVKIKGVTANKSEVFLTGNANVVADAIQENIGTISATRVPVDSAYAAYIPTGSMVRVDNGTTAAKLRPYRLLPNGSSVTVANTSDIVTYFRNTNHISYAKLSGNTSRFSFLRNGIGPGQVEPLDVSGDVHLTFSIVSGDIIKVQSDTAELSARVGDMMVIFDNIEKCVVHAESIGGGKVRYTLGKGIESDMWIGINVVTSGFSDYPSFNGNFTIIALGVHSSGTYEDHQYFEVTNGAAGTETINAKVTIQPSQMPFALHPLMRCKTLSAGYSDEQEYIGFPVVQVNNLKEILVVSPAIKEAIVTNGTDISITLSPHLYPMHRRAMIFVPALYNEKNIRTNRKEGSMYEELVNSGEIKYLIKTLSRNFCVLIASNSANESTDDLRLDSMMVNTDDWLELNSSFGLSNRGIHKIVAHNGRNLIVFYNEIGGQDEVVTTTAGGTASWLKGPITSTRPIKVYDAEHIFADDKLFIGSPNVAGGGVLWFPNALLGSWKIQKVGFASCAKLSEYESTFDTTLLTPCVDVLVTGAPATSDVNNGEPIVLGSNVSSISFQESEPAFGFRYVAGRTVTPNDASKGHVYLLPEINSMQMSQALGTKLSCQYKLSCDENVVRGIDGYLTFAGLVRESHRVVDGSSSNTALYPGIRAAGTTIEILTPIVKSIFIRLGIKPKDGVDISIISEVVRATVAGYINKLPVGKPVILSEIIKVVQSLAGVYSVTVIDTIPSAQDDRIVVGDIEKALVFDAQNDIVVS